MEIDHGQQATKIEQGNPQAEEGEAQDQRIAANAQARRDQRSGEHEKQLRQDDVKQVARCRKSPRYKQISLYILWSAFTNFQPFSSLPSVMTANDPFADVPAPLGFLTLKPLASRQLEIFLHSAI